MKKPMLSAILVLMLTVSVYAHTGELVITGESRYKAVVLTPAVYNNATADLSDLRVRNGAGENVPYFISSYYDASSEMLESIPMSLINSYVKEDDFYFDYEADGVSGDVTATSVLFSTDIDNFAKTIEVYGSYDNRHWEHVLSDNIYSVNGHERLELAFGSAQKYTCYRFRLNNNLEKISFSNVLLQYREHGAERSYFTYRLSPEFRIEEADRETLLTISGVKNLRLSELEISAEGMFTRTVSSPLSAAQEIYALSFDGQSYRDTAIEFPPNTVAGDELTLTIANHDDSPLRITGVSLSYYADELVFLSLPGEKYSLYFDADQSKPAPVYDIARYREQVLREGADRVFVGEITLEQITPEEIDYGPLFSGVIIAVSVMLGLVILFNLKKRPDA